MHINPELTQAQVVYKNEKKATLGKRDKQKLVPLADAEEWSTGSPEALATRNQALSPRQGVDRERVLWVSTRMEGGY